MPSTKKKAKPKKGNISAAKLAKIIKKTRPAATTGKGTSYGKGKRYKF